jgi:hypothetical protein
MNSRQVKHRPSPNKRDTAEVRIAMRLLKTRTRHALYATGVFVLSCASVWLFLAGSPLQAYWKSVGRNLILLPAVLLLPFVIFVGRAINAWLFVREMKRIEM